MGIEKIRKLIAELTLEEKAGLCSGADFWHTKAVQRLGIPQTMVADGPHGLRKQNGQGDHLGVNNSIKAVCFPAACATAASFDRELLTLMGQTIGDECQAEGLSVILGPAVNIKRSPLCGRNFEYYSEDPYLSTEMAGALIKGVQSKNVGTSIKHFLANNQELHRMTSSSEVDERTLREIYLAAFEGAVVKEKPWTVMCSYNKINGTYASENSFFLTDILRKEWGFEGYVMSDWGAVNERVPGLLAGLDLEMPSSGGINDELIVDAVISGTLDEKVLDQACERILNIVFRFEDNKVPDTVWDMEADHELCARIAQECCVLLKNETNILPLKESDKIAFIGKYAKEPRYQGGGSSHINSFKTTSAMDAIEGLTNITYAEGFLDNTDEIEESLKAEAIEAARMAQVAVIFAGLPDSFESEGYDRKHMGLPACQNDLIEAVCKVQPNTVVVLHNGSPVDMPWVDKVRGILEVYLSGQAVGLATTNILFGKANPCGRLPETFPSKLEHNPSYPYYGGEGNQVEYREGVFVGYRYYETKKIDVLFPFGHGLSYTSFMYSNLHLDKDAIKDTDTLTVSVDVTNTGKVTGKEVIQLYISPIEGEIIRPTKELRGFEKVELLPGETKTVSFKLDKRAFSYWNTILHDWHVESGKYEIMIGKSVREIVLSEKVAVQSTVTVPHTYSLNSRLGEIMKNPKASSIMGTFSAGMGEGAQEQKDSAVNSNGAISSEMMEATIAEMPLRGLLSFIPGLKREALQQMVDMLNQL
jgi:beta-glucosidase